MNALCCAVFIAQGVAYGAEPATAGKALVSVVGIAGKGAEGSSDGEGWKELTLGARLGMGAVIKTGQKSEVELLLWDAATVVRLKPATKLVLEHLELRNEEAPMTVILLQEGRIIGTTEKVDRSKLNVSIRNGVVVVLWGDFAISSRGQVTVGAGKMMVAVRVPGVLAEPVWPQPGETYEPPESASQLPGTAPTPREISLTNAVEFQQLRRFWKTASDKSGRELESPAVAPKRPKTQGR